MAITLPIIGVAFTSLCVWLTVRIVNRRERWTKWTLAAVVGLPVLYVASFGPACWISSRANVGFDLVPIIYHPVTWGMSRRKADTTIDSIIAWYARFGAAENWEWTYVLDPTIRWEWGEDIPAH